MKQSVALLLMLGLFGCGEDSSTPPTTELPEEGLVTPVDLVDSAISKDGYSIIEIKPEAELELVTTEDFVLTQSTDTEDSMKLVVSGQLTITK
ncbi:hypothetical protein BCU68_09785 [Vibrio sp. 10N.286.49.B3]|uniref:hypothetical protein n=1 Tax=Vibrio sp. 10N.286.49.B3 TaxID=1880855 RepID=UPI000C85E208|nr:hypothetical protein [Vibrio sp. 10N.286.49.B3]PMH46065.1 hypothetical protein BCU68_09785 [Vibrio sp. 10N.286.49.B3]